ncbi:hypothetical protein LTR12_001889 [Friedmanniomyces endolithicus]|nr:hypothetical protein LTR12_001889 [Friedmanniomyces endolithicus]
MQYKTLAVSAFVASAFAAPQASASVDHAPRISIYSVLQTALPSSLVAEALTNPSAASSDIAAEFATATPSWFTALPTDIQTYLVPLATNGASLSAAVGNATAAANATMSSTMLANGTAPSAGVAGMNSMNSSGVAGATAAMSSSASLTSIASSMSGSSIAVSSTAAAAAGASSTGSSGASSTSKAGAVPTAVVGMGLAGMVGIVGLFAL